MNDVDDEVVAHSSNGPQKGRIDQSVLDEPKMC